MSIERLDKIIASQTVYSRKEVKELIRKGQVLVAGERALAPEQKCDPDRDPIVVCGEVLAHERFTYLMLHKPAGVITATSDPKNRTVMDLLSAADRARALFPAGRLDKDTEGLLLITNDGDLAHRLMAPGKHVEKVYYVTVEGSLGEGEQEAFREGMILADGSRCREAELNILEQSTEQGIVTTNALVTLSEGKYHQIKRMFGKVDRPVLYLKRLRIGPLVLDETLLPGQYRKLTAREIEALHVAIGMNA